MKNHPSVISVCVAALAAGATLFSAAIVQANDVFSLKFTGTGRYQTTKNYTNGDSTDVTASQGFTSQLLVNLATGNLPTTKMPANIVLAMESDCAGGASIIVYDKIQSNVVATIASLDLIDANQPLDTQKEVCTGKGEDQTCDQPTVTDEYFLEFAVNAVGNSGIESINGGDLFAYLKVTLDQDSGCPTAFSGTAMGTIGFSFTNKSGDLVTLELLVTKATLSTGRKIGTLTM